MKTLHASSLILISIAALAGCSKKTPECQSMITTVINPTAEALKKVGEKKSEKPAEVSADLKEMAKIATDAAGKMGKLEITTEELKKHAADYQAINKEVASAATSTAEAMDLAAKAEAAATKAAADMKTATDVWGAFCQDAKHLASEAAGCKSFAETLQKLPDDPEKHAETAKVIADLDKVEWKSDEAKANAKKVTAALVASQKSMTDAKAAEAKAKAAQTQVEAAEKKEGTAIDALNKFCQE